jgi:tetratricopeptide (TPR) repeat protein
MIILDTKKAIHLEKTEYAEARQLVARIVQMTSPHRSPYFHANSLLVLVQLDIITGIHDAATLRNLAATRELASELPFYNVTLTCDVCQAELDLRNGDRTKAYTTLKILGKRTELPYDSVYLSLANLGDLSNNLCSLETTFHWAITYFALSQKRKQLCHSYQALRCLGDVLLAQGDEQTAMNIFQAVLEASTEMDVHQRRADCMARIGDILVRRGEPDKAKDMWEAALPLFVRSSQAKDAAAIETKLAQLADRDSDALSEISSAGISTQKSYRFEIAPREELASGEDATTEIPAELLNLRAPTGQPVAKSEVGEMVVMAGENEKLETTA